MTTIVIYKRSLKHSKRVQSVEQCVCMPRVNEAQAKSVEQLVDWSAVREFSIRRHEENLLKSNKGRKKK